MHQSFAGRFSDLGARGLGLACLALLLCACPDRQEPPSAPAASGASGNGDVAPSAPANSPSAARCAPSSVAGKITRNTTWCGQVEVTGDVLVAPEAILTVEPGARVRFRPGRDRLRPDRRITLQVEGQLRARGTADKPIRFTSGHATPRNGDWRTIRLVEADGSVLEHVVVEYGETGLDLLASDIIMRQAVVRYNNWHGVSVNGAGEVIISGSRIYANGYNCLDVTDGASLHLTTSYLANCQELGLHVGRSKAHVEENLFEGHIESVYLSHGATVDLIANTFTAHRGMAITCSPKVTLRLGNSHFAGRARKDAVDCPKAKPIKQRTESGPPDIFRTGLQEEPGSWLGYIPGQDARDPYPYVLPDRTATRQVVAKIGAGLWTSWALAWDEPNLWVADTQGKVKRLDVRKGEVLKTIETSLSKPWGMAALGGALWINDFSQRAIFRLEPKTGKLRKVLACPDPRGTCAGLASDGKDLFVLGYATAQVYVVSPAGEVTDHFPAPALPTTPGQKVSIPVRGALVWDGEAFWAPAGRLIRFTRQGKVLGWVHSTGSQVTGLAWDGDALWTAPRLSGAWRDGDRFYRVKVLKLALLK